MKVLTRGVAVAVALLMLSTWRLWFLPDNLSIAMIDGTESYAWITPGLVILSLGYAVACATPASAGCVSLGLVVAVACDQHRLQPWVYQAIAYTALLFLLQKNAAVAIRAIAVSVYVYSAIGKFDYQFLHTVGQDFVGVAAHWVGVETTEFGWPLRITLASLFPATELLVALLLIVPKTRRWGGIAAVGLHLGLIVMLSPLGLSHSLGVLSWNACLIAQSWWLFIRPGSSPINLGGTAPWRRSIGWGLTAMVLCMPLFERAGYWDHWTSWALYSPHNSRVLVQIHPAAAERLPPSLRSCVGPPDDGWGKLSLSHWSLTTRWVPIVPQSRYQLALAAKIAVQNDLGGGIRVIVRGPADRLTGHRAERRLAGTEAITQGAGQFWLVEEIR